MLKLLTIVVLLSAVSLLVGVGTLASGWDHGATLLVASRVPRTVAVVLTGASLAIGGLIMQSLARNRFVDPILAGGGQSAALGILGVTLIAPHAAIGIKMLASTLGSLVGMAMFLAMARRAPQDEPYQLALMGIVYGGVIGALATAIAWQADLMQYLEIWIIGEFKQVVRGRYELLWLTALLMVAAWWVADRLTIHALGHQASVSLGLDHRSTRRIGLAVVSCIAGCTVVTVGVLPFVGLVVPAIVSMWIGDDVRRAIPIVALGGAALLLASDLLGRVLRFPYEIPAGTVMGVVGAAIFLYLLYRRSFRHA